MLSLLTAFLPAVGAFMKPLEGRRPPVSQRRILNAAVFGSIPFVFICVASAIIAFTLFTPSFFLVSYTGTLGFSDGVAAQLNMGYNLSSAAGRVIFGVAEMLSRIYERTV